MAERTLPHRGVCGRRVSFGKLPSPSPSGNPAPDVWAHYPQITATSSPHFQPRASPQTTFPAQKSGHQLGLAGPPSQQATWKDSLGESAGAASSSDSHLFLPPPLVQPCRSAHTRVGGQGGGRRHTRRPPTASARPRLGRRDIWRQRGEDRPD